MRWSPLLWRRSIPPSWERAGPCYYESIGQGRLAVSDLDIIEVNEAFAVQALYCLDRLGLERMIRESTGGEVRWPSASPGRIGTKAGRFPDGPFKESASARYGLTTMCVGRGQGIPLYGKYATVSLRELGFSPQRQEGTARRSRNQIRSTIPKSETNSNDQDSNDPNKLESKTRNLLKKISRN